MLKAVLLDLDNTLILFDETAFYLRFMDRISPFFEDMIADKEFSQRLLRAIGRLSKSDGSLSLKDYFMNLFCREMEDQRGEIWKRFMRFYHTEYEKIPVDVVTPAGVKEVLDQLTAWNLRLVLATNPIFPETALKKRMAWVGLEPEAFELTTHMENMAYAKPRPEYYRQICKMIGVQPQEGIMVGNDSINDIAAGTTGMKTFLTTDAGPIDYRALTKGRKAKRNVNHPADFKGPLTDLIPTIARLNNLSATSPPAT